MPNVGFKRKELKRQLGKYEKIRDCLEGEEAVKDKGSLYLPIPEASADETENMKKFKKYLQRAVFYGVTSRTTEGLVGQVFQKEIVFDVPTQFGFLQMDIDGAATTLEQHAKCTLEEIVSIGRGGLLVDSPVVEEGQVVTRADVENGSIRPRVIFYRAEQIINWREINVGGQTKLSLLVLKEDTEVDDDGFEFKHEDRWREIRLDEETGTVYVQMWKRKDKSKTGQGETNEFEEDGEPIQLLDKDGNQLQEIPFSFIGVLNNDSSVDEPPMNTLANLNIAHFRDSADYQQSSFLCGQPTPVFTGLTQQWVDDNMSGPITLGSSNAVALPVGGQAQLLQAEPNSQPFEAMKHKEEQMKAVGAKLIEPGTVEKTATEAEIEETSEASILSSAAKNVSAAYEKAIMYCSIFFGDSELSLDEITVKLNSEFQITGLSAQERQEVVAAWQNGVLVWEEVREVYRKKGIATLSDDEARTKIDDEFGSGAFSSQDNGGAGSEEDDDDETGEE